MATKTITSLLDDLDGDDADETVSFSLDGSNYEIDLNGKNASELRAFLDRYIEAGRKLRRGAPSNVRPARPMTPPVKEPGSGLAKDDREAIQEFARTHDLPVPADRGRIAASVMAAWEAAGSPR